MERAPCDDAVNGVGRPQGVEGGDNQMAGLRRGHGGLDGVQIPHLAFEIMHLNNAVRSMVRDSRIHQIDSVIQTSAAE